MKLNKFIAKSCQFCKIVVILQAYQGLKADFDSFAIKYIHFYIVTKIYSK